jgi:hypothetical protein
MLSDKLSDFDKDSDVRQSFKYDVPTNYKCPINQTKRFNCPTIIMILFPTYEVFCLDLSDLILCELEDLEVFKLENGVVRNAVLRS